VTDDGRPIAFDAYLPEVFRTADGAAVLAAFLRPLETLFEELQSKIEGVPSGPLRLTVQAATGAAVTVAPFAVGRVAYPRGASVTVADRSLRTVLAEPLPSGGEGLAQIALADAAVAGALVAGDVVTVHPGGIPDLFDPDTTPPPQFMPTSSPEREAAFLAYLAGWIALPLRPDKPPAFNRALFDAARALYPQRGTLLGIDGLLRAWLRGDLLQTSPPEAPLLILTDLTPAYNDLDAVFSLGETATLGVDTVLGVGAPFFFVADVTTDPTVLALRGTEGLEVFQRAARALLDGEKPAYTYYQLRVRSHAMQLAADGETTIDGNVAARVGETTLLWDRPWVFDSESQP
jgi:hypothetical protein